MPAAKPCPNCGSELADHVGSELCFACLLNVGLSDLGDDPTADLGQTVAPVESPKETCDFPVVFGRYELLAELARGGQGVVYRARQKSPNRLVALKMIALGSWANEKHLKRFKTEAEAAANLDHPNIVPIYEVGQVGSQHYFTMKLIEGVSFRQVLAKGPLEVKGAAALIAQVARAIQYAHDRAVLHRDLKPGNILIDQHNRPYVTDFGLAKVIEHESTVTNTTDVLGTPAYMSPEQAAGRARELTCAVDVYGLGAVLYETLTGVAPFSGESTMETLRAVLEKEPKPPTLINPEVDRDMETICLKCLEKEPEKRYASAKDLAEDLERWLDNEPILARPATAIARGRKWVRRNPAPALAAPLILALLCAAAVIVSLNATKQKTSDPNIKSFGVIVRAGDGNSKTLAKRYSQDLNHFLNQLSSVRALERSRTLQWEASTEPPADIQNALGASAVILATVRELNDFQLDVVLAVGGTSVWHHVFTNTMNDWSAIRSQIGREAMLAANVPLTSRDREQLRRPLTTNQLAQSAYFRGLRSVDALDEAAIKEAVAEFRQAILLDPRFPEAYAGVAYGYINLAYNFTDPHPHLAKAREAINQAAAIDSSLPQVRIIDGILKYFYEWDWEGARLALDDALRLDVSAVEANACYLHILDVFGRPEDALEKVRHAVAIYPQSLGIKSELSCASYYAGRFDQAISYAHDMIKDDPENAFNYFSLARALAQKGKSDEALDAIRIGKTKTPKNYFALEGEAACIEAQRGRTNEAREILGALKARTEFVDPYVIALVHATLGETNEVFQFLEKAYAHRSSSIPSLGVEVKFAKFRSDPRFRELLSRLKMPIGVNYGSFTGAATIRN